jgi:pyridoxine 5-phosphate synthase
MRMTRLSVNVNKVATLRNTRATGEPSVVRCAELCVRAGAHGITIHPRPDQRHIRAHDVDAIAEMLRAHAGVELNIEGNPFHGLLDHVERVRPTQCTLVPDATTQSTSDHGFDLAEDATRLAPVIVRLRTLGCRSSLFVDADVDAVSRAHALAPIASSSTPSRTRAHSRVVKTRSHRSLVRARRRAI